LLGVFQVQIRDHLVLCSREKAEFLNVDHCLLIFVIFITILS